MKENVAVACATDKNFIQHTGVMLCSLFENNKDILFDVYVLVPSEESFAGAFSDFLSSYCHNIHFITVDEKRLKNCPLSISYISTLATYYRMLLPDLLPDDLEKVIYLDSDMIINGSITEFWRSSLKDRYLAGVLNPVEEPFQKDLLKNLCLDESQYFNAGVLLLNLRYLKSKLYSEDCISWANDNHDKIVYNDQDVLNAVVSGNWLPVPPKYNNIGIHYYSSKALFKHWTKKEISEAKKEPVIIHYCGEIKPWHYRCKHPYAKEYLKYIKKTPWKDFKFDDKNMVNMIKKHLPNKLKLFIKKVLFIKTNQGNSINAGG